MYVHINMNMHIAYTRVHIHIYTCLLYVVLQFKRHLQSSALFYAGPKVGVVFDMSSDRVKISKHSLVHQASKECKVSANQLETLCQICELLLDKPGRICDAKLHLEAFLQKDDDKVDEAWPGPDDIKCFSSIPKEWPWEFLGRQQKGFTASFIKKIEMKQKGLVREIAEFTTDLPAGASVPKAFADQEVSSRMLDARNFGCGTSRDNELLGSLSSALRITNPKAFTNFESAKSIPRHRCKITSKRVAFIPKQLTTARRPSLTLCLSPR